MPRGGTVYTETNSSHQNAILVFNRMEDGQLFSTTVGAVLTGGAGTGTGLGSQGALAIDPNNTFLFAVNAGSNNISTFRITDQGPQPYRVDVVQWKQAVKTRYRLIATTIPFLLECR